MAASTSLDDMCDADLVRHAMAGGRDAFAEIYRRYHTVIYRFARMMSGSPAAAEDVTQETFTMLLRDLQRYTPDRAALSTYLYGVARNLTRSRLRRERRFVHLDVKEDDEPASATDPSTVFEQSQQRQRLRQIIAELPSRYREVIVLCAIHGLSYAEVAAILGTPVGTVRSRLSRARHAIANRLRDLEANTDAVPIRTARCAV
jgi:RNA polymerase sigma-70 factor (ECF subfamily)